MEHNNLSSRRYKEDLDSVNEQLTAAFAELSTIRAENDNMREALEAARIFITPLEILRNKENWDDYKQDAARRINAALAPRGQEGEGEMKPSKAAMRIAAVCDVAVENREYYAALIDKEIEPLFKIASTDGENLDSAEYFKTMDDFTAEAT